MEPSLRPVFYLSYIIQKQNTFHKILAQTLYIVAPDKLVPDSLLKVKENCDEFIKSSTTLQQTYYFNQLPRLWEEPSTNSSVKQCKLSRSTEEVMIFFNKIFLETPKYIPYAVFGVGIGDKIYY